MLDLKYVCDNIEIVTAALNKRSGNYPVAEIAALAERRKKLIREVEDKKAEKNIVSDTIATIKRAKEDATELIEDMKAKGEIIKALDNELNEVVNSLSEIMLRVPNLPHESVPYGIDSENNIEIRKYGEPRVFNYDVKAHWDIGENLNILSFNQAGKITGARFTVYRGLGARLERAIINLMLDTHTNNGYTEILPPFIVNRDSMQGTGQLPKFEDDMFKIEGSNYFLIPTAEVPVTNLHRDDILKMDELPISYTAYTACFRAEAGSAGRDTRGLIRQHQFNKVELVKFSEPSDSYNQLEKLTADAESILKLLNLPYRVVTLCTGDIGFGSAKTYDIEVFMPSYNRYLEISSCSNYEDFQARRANIKYRDNNGKLRYVHTLNGSGLAVGRTVAAILENYQNCDGTVSVPNALIPYMGVEKIV